VAALEPPSSTRRPEPGHGGRTCETLADEKEDSMNVQIANPLTGLLATQGRHLGDLVRWELHGIVRQDVATAAAARFGLLDDLDFPVVTPNSAYRHAVRQSVRGGKADERRYEVVKVEESPSKIVHAIVEKTVENKTTGSTMTNRDATFSTETRVGFDKDAYFAGGVAETMLQVEHPDHPIVARIRALYGELCVTYKTEDIRVASQRAFTSWHATAFGSGGGLWWAPSTAAEKVRSWAEWMEELGHRAYVIPLFDTEETVRALQLNAYESVENQMNALLDQMAAFSHKDNTRASTLERRVEEFDRLRDSAELYETLLGAQMSTIKERLVAAQKALVASISAMSAEPEAAAQGEDEVE
jgi:hypothetical protein